MHLRICALSASAMLICLTTAAVPAAPLSFHSNARANGSAGNDSQGGSQEVSNQRLANVETQFHDQLLNESSATAALMLDDGTMQAAVHACSGGRSDAGGNANAGGFVSFDQTYLVMGGAPGSRVHVSFNVSSAAMLFAIGKDLDNFQDSGGINAHMQYTIDGIVSESGSRAKTISYPNTENNIVGGMFDASGATRSADFNVFVGDTLRLSIAADIGAGSQSFGVGEIDGQGQMAVTWGFDVSDGAFLSTDDDPMNPKPAPPLEHGGPGPAVDAIPPPTETSPPTPEPASLGVLSFGLLISRRRRCSSR